VFAPFYRVSDKLRDGVTGTGIGLAIARELARLNGGDLELVDAEKGTCFRLTLVNQGEEGHESPRS
jgi:signal transduction histidine kinase